MLIITVVTRNILSFWGQLSIPRETLLVNKFTLSFVTSPLYKQTAPFSYPTAENSSLSLLVNDYGLSYLYFL